MADDDQDNLDQAPVPTTEQALSFEERADEEDLRASGPHNTLTSSQYQYEQRSVELTVGALPPPSMLNRYNSEFQRFILEEAQREGEHARDMDRAAVRHRDEVLETSHQASIRENEARRASMRFEFALTLCGLLLASLIMTALLTALVIAVFMSQYMLAAGLIGGIGVAGAALLGGRSLVKQISAERRLKELQASERVALPELETSKDP